MFFARNTPIATVDPHLCPPLPCPRTATSKASSSTQDGTRVTATLLYVAAHRWCPCRVASNTSGMDCRSSTTQKRCAHAVVRLRSTKMDGNAVTFPRMQSQAIQQHISDKHASTCTRLASRMEKKTSTTGDQFATTVKASTSITRTMVVHLIHNIYFHSKTWTF